MRLTRPKNPMQRMSLMRSVRENQGHLLGRAQPPPLPHPRGIRWSGLLLYYLIK